MRPDPQRRALAGAGTEAHERSEAGAERAAEREHDPEHQQQAEAAHHRHWGEQQHQESGRRREAGRDDRRAARDHGRHRRLGVSACLCLVEAGLELDRVVHRQADQHGQRRDRRHREAAARERQRAEGHGRRGERKPQRQQPQARAEHQRQRSRHQHQSRSEQDEDRALHGVGEPLRHHRHARDDVARALSGLEDLLPRRLPNQVDRARLLCLGEVRPQADLDQRRVLRGEQVGEPRLGHARLSRGPVEHERGHEGRVVDSRDAAEPVLERQPERFVDELRLDRIGGGLRKALLLRGRIATPLRELARGLGGLLRLRGGGLLLLRELVLDLTDSRVDERGRPVHDLRGLQVRDLPADRRQAAEPLLVVGNVAAEAALEPQHAIEVRCQHGAREVAVHEHEDGLAAEVALEALRVLEALRATVHERLRGRARLEAQRESSATQRQHGGEPKHQQRPPRNCAHEASERALDHAVSLGEAQGSGSRCGNWPDWPTMLPSGACGSHGGAALRFSVPPKMNCSI